jgi:hypothetical protein
MYIILSLNRVTIEGVWIGNRIYRTLTTHTIHKDNALTLVHTSQITIGHNGFFSLLESSLAVAW